MACWKNWPKPPFLSSALIFLTLNPSIRHFKWLSLRLHTLQLHWDRFKPVNMDIVNYKACFKKTYFAWNCRFSPGICTQASHVICKMDRFQRPSARLSISFIAAVLKRMCGNLTELMCEFQNTELRAQYYEVVMLPVHKRALAVAMNSEGPRVCYAVART